MPLVDIHTHGIAGYDTRTTSEEHILKMAEIHGSFGVAAIVPTIYSATTRVMRDNMMVVRRAMEMQRARTSHPEAAPGPTRGAPPSFDETLHAGHPPAAILGVHLEGPFLNPSYCGALNAMTFIEPAASALRELLDGYEDIVKIVTVAPELDGAPALIRDLSDRGIAVSMGHSDATFAEAEAGCRSGARGITHLFNAMRGVHHREPGIAGFGLLNRHVYVEVIADPYHLHPATLELIFTLKDPERILIVSDSVAEAKTGREDLPVSDRHGTLLGGSMTVAESAARLISRGFDRDCVNRCVTENPLRFLEGRSDISPRTASLPRYST